ncbi:MULTISPECIES: hypothetical protein [unclassified Chelatococcus]|uniref:hypothetical protein n=1 Tax=unclassified Chelatococcus TaxID=2638111 RepID=UPI001BCC42E2|nr:MULTISPECIES: hypothetical protein [unclassified Chelatococcus]MBS7697890.1 hypothetical protein [Chelatococcus sp. YT9]MBX3558533.1 hypothetical protein [Chelatococcus sp.]
MTVPATRIAGKAAATIVIALAGGVFLPHGPAVAQDSPVNICRNAGDDNMLRPLPPSLLAAAKAAFGRDLEGPDQANTAVWRCMGGRAYVCLPGGDRHCGRADSQPMATPEASAYCSTHPDSAAVPSHATGRDTIFSWGCEGKAAKNKGSVRSVDPRGFVKEYWRPLE